MTKSFLLASTTNYGLRLAQSLIQADFICLGVLTPPARIVGRKKELVKTPVEIWARKQNLPIFWVEKKITSQLIANLSQCDFLLVVDFGYYIPEKLAAHPRLLALNVHPSALPRWRGSSPGQAIILHGEKESAVSFITLAQKMDAGDLLAQIPFAVGENWTKDEYYDFAFKLAEENLPAILTDFAHGKIKPQPQKGSPTFALKLARADGFIANLDQDPLKTYRQWRAYHPWPGIWTLDSQKKRVKILACHLDNNGQLVLDLIQKEGEKPRRP